MNTPHRNPKRRQGDHHPIVTFMSSPLVVSLWLLIISLVTVVAIAVGYRENRHQTIRTCHAVLEVRAAVVDILQAGQVQMRNNHRLTAAQHQETEQFYNAAIHRMRLIHCKH